MLAKKHSWSIYLIILTIILSLIIQGYWNYKNYLENKKAFITNVQHSLDNTTDNYFANLAKDQPKFEFTNKLKTTKEKITVYIHDGKFEDKSKIKMDWNQFEHRKKRPKNYDSLNNLIKKTTLEKATDSLIFIKGITTLYMSITSDSLDLPRFNNTLNKEFKRNKIKIPYILNHYINNKLIETNDSVTVYKKPIKTVSKSTYLKKNEKIELEFPNQTFTILKLGFVGILLSLILSLAIISSLFYLLNIIKKQKQIAEIKNDFISNITHEFKTPITTIGLATEALKVYSKEHNQIKTDEYLDITQNQVGKLNKMVEKVLETSVIEKDKLLLDKQPTNLVKLINQAVNKQFLSHEKSIQFKTDIDKLIVNLDAFHSENALNNLIDNAIKYGGNKIEISLKSTSENIIITIRDNGKIKPEHKSKLFDKFYRIPKGNTHNVKGFGIGLYYTKKIIEKHQGSIEIANTSQTTFIIKLPKYEK